MRIHFFLNSVHYICLWMHLWPSLHCIFTLFLLPLPTPVFFISTPTKLGGGRRGKWVKSSQKSSHQYSHIEIQNKRGTASLTPLLYPLSPPHYPFPNHQFCFHQPSCPEQGQWIGHKTWGPHCNKVLYFVLYNEFTGQNGPSFEKYLGTKNIRGASPVYIIPSTFSTTSPTHPHLRALLIPV